MSTETHSQIANFIWSICNLLRGPYKRNEYRKVILPLTVLRRFDCIGLWHPGGYTVSSLFIAVRFPHGDINRGYESGELPFSQLVEKLVVVFRREHVELVPAGDLLLLQPVVQPFEVLYCVLVFLDVLWRRICESSTPITFGRSSSVAASTRPTTLRTTACTTAPSTTLTSRTSAAPGPSLAARAAPCTTTSRSTSASSPRCCSS